MGDRRTAVLRGTHTVSSARRLGVLALCAALAAGCVQSRSTSTSTTKTSSRRASTRAIGEMTADVHAQIASFDVIEIAVQRPGGDTAISVKRGFREAVYEGLLERGYSPLALEYVDAARSDVARPGQTFPMRGSITQVKHASDGGFLVSGWLGLVAPRESGGETTLYLAEISDLALPPQRGTYKTDGGEETGRRLAAALLKKLPAR